MVFVAKPSGMLMHRGWDRDPITVSDLVRDEIVKDKVYALHRLDRATSGVVGFATDAEMAAFMQSLFQKHAVEKRYLAIVRGPFTESLTLDHPVPKEPKGERVGAQTEFQPLARAERWSLVLAIPRSGRLHQIRRHLKHLSLPVVGDTKYGKGDVNRHFREQHGLNRLALHALSIKFKNPASGEETMIEAPLEGALKNTIQSLFGEVDF